MKSGKYLLTEQHDDKKRKDHRRTSFEFITVLCCVGLDWIELNCIVLLFVMF